jgi:hypothetical protein
LLDRLAATARRWAKRDAPATPIERIESLEKRVTHVETMLEGR